MDYGRGVSLEPVDAANVTVLEDNFFDALMPSGEVAQRPQWLTTCGSAGEGIAQLPKERSQDEARRTPTL